MNDQSVLQKGPDASASVTIIFQKSGECQDLETENDDDVRVTPSYVCYEVVGVDFIA